MKMVFLIIRKKLLLFLLLISIFLPFFVVTKIYSSELYDLCYQAAPLNDNKLFFIRYRNPLLDPLLRTYELYLYNPFTKRLSFLQKHDEKIYILPIVSRDRTTICYHSLIEGTDFLVTKNIERGKTIRLRFDTGGYFVKIALDYDDDTIAAGIKRGEEKQAIYRISNRESSLRRICNGTDFIIVGFLDDGSIFYVEKKDSINTLGIINPDTNKKSIISSGVLNVIKSPDGDVLIFRVGDELRLYRIANRETIPLFKVSQTESPQILFTPDGTAAAIIGNNEIHIVNIPSGDVLYYLSMDTHTASKYLTNFVLYITKGNSVFMLKHKKPGASLKELYKTNSPIVLLAVSPDDRYLVYHFKNEKQVFIHDTVTKKNYQKEFGFSLRAVLYPFHGEKLYLIGQRVDQKTVIPIKELYFYDFINEVLYPISTSKNTDIKRYLRRE